MKLIALGATMRSDDAVMLELAARRFGDDPRVALILAGRPGPGLVDLLDTDESVLLLDVVVSGRPPGTVHQFTLAELTDHARALTQLSSHGFGPAEALELARALGRPTPRGEFIGIEGARFDLGQEHSPELDAKLDELGALIDERITALTHETPCTNPA